MSQYPVTPYAPSFSSDFMTSLESLTAKVHAAVRMIETMKPEPLRLMQDPYAHYFVSEKSLALARYQDEFVPVLGRQVILEARFIDDTMRDAFRAGIRQVVLLGAGHDCRALRLAGSYPSETVFFEVDRPKTLRYKRHMLLKYLLRLPPEIKHVPHDLCRSTLWEALGESGYVEQAPSLFVLEGVVPYLSERVVPDLLSGIRKRACPGSRVVITSVDDTFIEVARSSEAYQEFLEAYERQGEVLQCGIAAKQMKKLLTKCGFTQIEQHPIQAIEQRYCPTERMPEIGHVTVAHH